MSLLASATLINPNASFYALAGSGGSSGITSVTAGTGIAVTTPSAGVANVATNLLPGTNISLTPGVGNSITISATGAPTTFESVLASSLENFPPGITTAIWWEGQSFRSTVDVNTPVLFDTNGPPQNYIPLPPSIVSAMAGGDYKFMDVWGTIPMFGDSALFTGYLYEGDLFINGANTGTTYSAPNNFFFPPDVQPAILNGFGNTYSFKFTIPLGGTTMAYNETNLRFYFNNRTPIANYNIYVSAQQFQQYLVMNFLLHN